MLRQRPQTYEAVVDLVQGTLTSYDDYIFDWIFQQDGSIKVAVGATGIAEVKVVGQQTTTLAEAGMSGSNGPNGDEEAVEAANAYGHFVDRQIVAISHDHYFIFRLDLDVDGATNSLRFDRLVSKELPVDHPRRSVWVPEPKITKKESEAMLRINPDRPTVWRVVSESSHRHAPHGPRDWPQMPVMWHAFDIRPFDFFDRNPAMDLPE